MEPETEQQRDAREAALATACEALGLVVHGSTVIAPLGKPVAVDASVIDMQNLVACLMYLAHEQGKREGRDELRGQMNALLQPAQ